jgi:hypothetical protein
MLAFFDQNDRGELQSLLMPGVIPERLRASIGNRN